MARYELKSTFESIHKEKSLKKMLEAMIEDLEQIYFQVDDIIQENKIDSAEGSNLLMITEGVQDGIKQIIEQKKIK